MGPSARPDSEERLLATELTRIVVGRVASDELPVFDETAEEYFADPGAPLRRASDNPLGAGIPVEMLTPYLLWASTVVLPVLGEIAKGVGVDVVKEPVSVWIRRLFRRSPTEPPTAAALTGPQADHVRHTIVAQCYRARLPSDQAALIADAVVGALHVRR